MKINKAYKFRLEPNSEQEIILNNLVGSARFVWNQMLAISFEMFAKNEFINATNLVNKIMDVKNHPDFEFLKTCSNAVSLQQKVRDLAAAWSRFFDPKVHARLKENKKKLRKPKLFKLANGTEIQLRPLMPRFKRKSDGCDSIRLVQFDKYCRVEGNRVKLPNGIGLVTFRKSQEIIGTIKNITISKKSGHWYVSFGTEREVENPRHPATSAIGLDMGISKLLTTSNGQYLKPKNSFKANQIKLAKLQRRLSKKVTFSENWKKQNRKIQKLHHHIAKENRQTQANFECVKCMYVANADVNAARNILAAGHAVLSVEGGCSKGRPLKQKTCDLREKVA